MTTRLIAPLRTLSACLVLFLAFAVPASAQKTDFDPYSVGIEENINTPSVPSRRQPKLVEAMTRLERKLKSIGYTSTRVRNGEVVLVTIPCADLFAPNSTRLSTPGEAALKALIPYVKRADDFKLVIAVHSDNTGDQTYADKLTEDRAQAIDEYLTRHAGNATTIVPYGLGFEEPVASNVGITNRAANRRVEFYLVPTELFIDKSQKK